MEILKPDLETFAESVRSAKKKAMSDKDGQIEREGEGGRERKAESDRLGVEKEIKIGSSPSRR